MPGNKTLNITKTKEIDITEVKALTINMVDSCSITVTTDGTPVQPEVIPELRTNLRVSPEHKHTHQN